MECSLSQRSVEALGESPQHTMKAFLDEPIKLQAAVLDKKGAVSWTEEEKQQCLRGVLELAETAKTQGPTKGKPLVLFLYGKLLTTYRLRFSDK